MKNLDEIAEDLFDKIRGRFKDVTIGNENGEVVNKPRQARFFDFEYETGNEKFGRVSISLDSKSLSVMYMDLGEKLNNDVEKDEWFKFLKGLRYFAKKRLLKFDIQDITKSSLDKRDYKFLSGEIKKNNEEENMNESTFYGTSKVSFQDVGNARIRIEHVKPIQTERSAERAAKINKIFIESPEGERFKYPYKHVSGARAMARHVSEGGKPYDDFGWHITTLSEELNSLKRFKQHVNRSKVMAEDLSGYMNIVEDRIGEVKDKIKKIQKEKNYREEVENYEKIVIEDIPEDVEENWIDQLTVKQFNEELKDVFPYVYRLIGEKTKSKELGPEDLEQGLEEDDDPCWDGYKQVGTKKKNGKEVPNCVPEDSVEEDYEQDAIDQEPDSNEDEYYKYGADDDNDVNHASEFDSEESALPITEFVLSHFDKNTGTFPKGETGILTMVEKEYGENYVETARNFIEKINETVKEYIDTGNNKDDELNEKGKSQKNEEINNRQGLEEGFNRLKNLAGLNS